MPNLSRKRVNLTLSYRMRAAPTLCAARIDKVEENCYTESNPNEGSALR